MVTSLPWATLSSLTILTISNQFITKDLPSLLVALLFNSGVTLRFGKNCKFFKQYCINFTSFPQNIFFYPSNIFPPHCSTLWPQEILEVAYRSKIPFIDVLCVKMKGGVGSQKVAQSVYRCPKNGKESTGKRYWNIRHVNLRSYHMGTL